MARMSAQNDPSTTARRIRFNAFDMNCVAHQSSGLWRHPDDQSHRYKELGYWTELAQLLERGTFDGIFIADVLGTYDVYGGSNEAAIRMYGFTAEDFKRFEKLALKPLPKRLQKELEDD